jgi:hypothetical protein
MKVTGVMRDSMVFVPHICKGSVDLITFLFRNSSGEISCDRSIQKSFKDFVTKTFLSGKFLLKNTFQKLFGLQI